MSGQYTEIVKEMLAAADAMDGEKYLSFYSDDVVYRFGNSPVLYGRQAIIDSSGSFFENVKAVKHDIKAIWEVGDTVLVDMDVNYTLRDGKEFSLPCCDRFRINGDKVQEMQIYMDITPVFG